MPYLLYVTYKLVEEYVKLHYRQGAKYNVNHALISI